MSWIDVFPYLSAQCSTIPEASVFLVCIIAFMDSITHLPGAVEILCYLESSAGLQMSLFALFSDFSQFIMIFSGSAAQVDRRIHRQCSLLSPSQKSPLFSCGMKLRQ